MKKISALLIIFSALLCNLQGQVPTWDWVKSYGGDGLNINYTICSDKAYNIYSTGNFDGDTFLFGNTLLHNNDSLSHDDFFVARHDSAGNEIWALTGRGRGIETAFGICCDPFGNIYVTGNFYSDTLYIGPFILINPDTLTSDLFILKIDSSGNVLWAINSGQAGYDIGTDIASDPAGNIYLTGEFYQNNFNIGTTSLNNNSPTGTSDIYIAKYDSSGNPIWANGAGGLYYDEPQRFSEVTDHFYLCGRHISDAIHFGNITLPIVNGSSPYIVKFDTSGTVIWAKGGAGKDANFSGDVKTDISGNVYLIGTFSSDSLIFDNIILLNNDSINRKMFIVKFDSSGQATWGFSTGRSYEEVSGSEIYIDSTGNIYCIGTFDSDSVQFGPYELYNSNGLTNMYFVKFNPAGNVEWGINAPGAGLINNTHFVPAPHGDFYISGHFNDDTASFGNIFLPNPFPNSLGIFLGKLTGNFTGVDEIGSDNLFHFYPNPAKDKIYIQLYKEGLFRILNLYGQEIYFSKLRSTEINVSALANGMYFLVCESGTKASVKKFCVQH